MTRIRVIIGLLCLASLTAIASTNVFYFAATATDDSGQTSLYSNEVIFTNPPGGFSVTLAWDPSPGTNVITNYTLFMGNTSEQYPIELQVGTKLVATVQLNPPLLLETRYYRAPTRLRIAQ